MTSAQKGQQTEEEKSKDIYFGKVAVVADEMIEAHGKEFAMGVLVLAARFIAEGRPLAPPAGQ